MRLPEPTEVALSRELYDEWSGKLREKITQGYNAINIPISYLLAEKLIDDLKESNWICTITAYKDCLKLEFRRESSDDTIVINRG